MGSAVEQVILLIPKSRLMLVRSVPVWSGIKRSLVQIDYLLFMRFMLLSFILNKQFIGVWLPFKLWKVTTSCLQLDIGFLLQLTCQVLFNLFLLSIEDVPCQYLIGEVSQRVEVSYSESLENSILFSVSVLIQHRGQVWNFIMRSSINLISRRSRDLFVELWVMERVSISFLVDLCVFLQLLTIIACDCCHWIINNID